ncbi:hypothetical protein [Metabacillus bambusae]|uniref:Type 4 fimbrial biogenesis protein PilX N-terminal domain-containing protein n=1 Tax=Metabacillus bambusae TaxID=2795218 RepID=A0ABS3N9N2_9BACI|nr:hypothetical protein [Metabacillus bambusae]MBO1514750.1 hypothetical protein [Metabacillus bambusae]
MIVLLTITIFTILGLLVLGFSLNNTKQIITTEQNVKTVDLAEMGITYYDVVLDNLAQSTITEVKKIIVEDSRLGKLQAPEQYKEKTIDIFIDKIQEFNSNPSVLTKSFNISKEDKFSIIIKDINKNSDHSLSITLNSEGSSQNNSKKTISSNVNVSLLNFTINPTDSEGDLGNGIDYTISITEPKDLLSCISSNVEFGTQNCSYTDSIVHLNNPVQDFENKLIVINGHLEGNKTFNKGIIDSTLYIKGNGSFEEPISGIHYSKLYVGGNAEFSNINQKIIDSTLVIMGSANFNQPITLDNNAIFLYWWRRSIKEHK